MRARLVPPQPPRQRMRRRAVRGVLPDRLHDPAREPFRAPPPQPHRSRALRLLSAAPVALAEDLLDLLPAHRLLLGDHPGRRLRLSRLPVRVSQPPPSRTVRPGGGASASSCATSQPSRSRGSGRRRCSPSPSRSCCGECSTSIGSAGSPATGRSASTGARCNTPITPGARATCTRAPGTCASGRSPRRSSSTTTFTSCTTAGPTFPGSTCRASCARAIRTRRSGRSTGRCGAGARPAPAETTSTAIGPAAQPALELPR